MNADGMLGNAIKTGFSLFHVGGCDYGGILGIESEHYDLLLTNGYLEDDVWRHEAYNDEPLREGLNIVFCTDALDDLWDCPGPDSIAPFLTHAHLASYADAREPNLTLVSNQNILALLLPLLSCYPTGDLPNNNRLKAAQCKPTPRDNTVRWLREEQDYSGRVHVCDFTSGGITCGEPICYSEFAWIASGVCLFYMCTGGDFVTRAWLLPFVTDAYKV